MLKHKIKGLIDLMRQQKVRLISSSLLIIAGYIGLREIDPNSILVLSGLALIIIGLLPWLVVLRRALWNKRYPEGGKWMKAARILLWSALLIFPITATNLWIWFTIFPMPDGFDGLGQFLLLLLSLMIAAYATGTFAALAFFIQLWRDQWHNRLNLVVLIYLCLLFIGIITLSELQGVL
jgi:UDP-N-acetylmuramyl pentapeptide phosphotransferase/UDP-N-acetylglucosamine-1-phosphate transferase